MKKVFAALLLVAVASGLASAAEINFTGNVGGGHFTGDWGNAANWFIHPSPAGRIPEAGDNISIDRGWGGATANLDGDTLGNKLTVGYWTSNELNISAGSTVDLSGNLLIGGRIGAHGKVTNSGDIITGSQAIVGDYGDGTLTMNGGSLTSTYFNNPGWWADDTSAAGQTTAHVQLNGGTITAWDWNMATHKGEKNGTMDLAGGTFVVTRADGKSKAENFVAEGWLTAYGGIGTVSIENVGANVVISGVVPEPASLVLLSLASLVLVVRRRK